MKFTAACIQLNSQDDIAANMRVVEAMVRKAAGKGASLICLPENAFLMQEPEKPMPSVESEQKILELSQSLARELKIWLLAGSTYKRTENGERCFNHSIFINDKGEVVSTYNKIHLFDVTLKNGEVYKESNRIAPGANAVLAETPWGKLGMTICYDVRFPHLYRQLAQNGADFLVIPAAFTHTTGKAHWHVLTRARAIENGCFVFATGQCGMHPGNRQTYGHSMIINPWGEVIAEASEDKPEIIYAEIDTAKVADVRAMVPSLKHDREYKL